MRGILIGGVSLLVAIMLLTAVVGSGADTTTPVPAQTSGNYSTAVLGQATAMTQQMSIPGPISGHEYHGHTNDQQLQLSTTQPAFASDVTAYQNQVDRMLGKGS